MTSLSCRRGRGAVNGEPVPGYVEREFRRYHVFPHLPVRQWVLAVSKRLRYFLQRDSDLQGAALRLFVRAVEQTLRAHSAGAGPGEPTRGGGVHPPLRLGAQCAPAFPIAWCRTGCSLPRRPGALSFTRPAGSTSRLFAAVQAKVRRELLQSFVRRGLLESDAAHNMAQWPHDGGFSVDATVGIEAADRPGVRRQLNLPAW